MIELLTSANNNLIVVPAYRGVRALIFPVVTNFHKMARRPGGVPRQQALRNAQSIETRVTERDLPAIADQHVETGDKDKIDQKARTKRYNIVVETKQRDRQQRQPDHQQ